MLTYDTLVTELESAWVLANFHEHQLIESIQPDTLDRTYKADLFPEHADPLNEDNIPPWVELSFNWSALHQLRSEGHSIDVSQDPLAMTWIYNVMVRDPIRERTDQDLVRLFQKSVFNGLRQFFLAEQAETAPVAVEVRRIYHSDGQTTELAYVHLISPNLSDLSEMWNERDVNNLRGYIESEFAIAQAVVQSLATTFTPASGPHGNYQSVDTA